MSKKSKRKNKSITTFVTKDGTELSFDKTSDNPEHQAVMDDIMSAIVAKIKEKFGEDSIKKVPNKK